MTKRYTLDDLQCDLGDLQKLLAAEQAILVEMNYGSGATRNRELDQVAALNRIADHMALRMSVTVDQHYHAIKGKAP